MYKYVILTLLVIFVIYASVVAGSFRIPDTWNMVHVGDRVSTVMPMLGLSEEGIIPTDSGFEFRIGTRRRNPIYPFTHRLTIMIDSPIINEAKVTNVRRSTSLRYCESIQFLRD